MGTAKWKSIADLTTAATQAWTREALLRCDPYLVWADAVTKPAGEDKLNIAVLVELTTAKEYLSFLKRMNSQKSGTNGLQFLPNGFEPNTQTRFITGLVTRRGLTALVSEVMNQLIERFTLQDARADIARSAQELWEKTIQLEQSAPVNSEILATMPRAGTYLGIVDDGLPVLRVRNSAHLTDQPAHLWDQGWQPLAAVGNHSKQDKPPETDDPYWQVAWEFLAPDPAHSNLGSPRGFLYGRRLKALPNQNGAAIQNDRDEYAVSGYFVPAPRQSHGAAVLGLLAPWISQARKKVEWPPHISGLAMVQLPTGTVLDTSGGSLAMRVLDGLRYILWQETSDRGQVPTPRPIVANVSYGVHAGPHDGTSMFERAVAEMLDDNSHMHLVLPVGNAARAGCHGRRKLSAKSEAGDSATFRLQVLPDNGRDTFIEIWLPPGAKVALSIRPPGSTEAYKIHEGDARVLYDPDPDDSAVPERVHFGAVYSKEVAQGTNGSMALVAIGSTKRMATQTLHLRGANQQLRRDVWGASGIWELTVKNLTSSPCTVDAWVERGDASPDLPAGSRQAYFPDSCCESVRLNNAEPEDTLNGIATMKHDRLHVVGAMRADGALSSYSAAGLGRTPAARRGPDVVVTADWSKSVPGVRTIGFVRGAITRINGTSAACAVYARALAEQLAINPNRSPVAQKPVDAPPEIDCDTSNQPLADPRLRGLDKRQSFPFGIDL